MSTVQVSKETSIASGLCNGHTVVGTSPVQLTDLSFKLERGLLIRAPGTDDPVANTACVWVGRKCVTADGNVGTGGMPIPPGQSLFLAVDDPTMIFVVSTEANQDVAWMGI